MSPMKAVGSVFTGLVGKKGKLFGQGERNAVVGYELAGVSVPTDHPRGRYAPDPAPSAPSRVAEKPFNIAAILRPRTFVYIIASTALLLFQIYNTLAIKVLSKRNEQLREQLRISTSISTSQELKARELQSIHNISGSAQALGLNSSPVPPVDIEP
ncbi:MAG: hypothetical protein HGB22_06855 [Chlorobiaceae bacterium]|nr:hypothetical protein [Chlorobiaceae bacterium]